MAGERKGGDLDRAASSLLEFLRSDRLDKHTAGIAGYLLGATRCLQCASQYSPGRVLEGGSLSRDYRRQLVSAAERIAAGREPEDEGWLHGWHFNSALHRLAACYERVPKLHLGVSQLHPSDRECYWRHSEVLQRIHLEVNELKHEGTGKTAPPKRKRHRARVTYAEASAALVTVVDHVLAVTEWRGCP